MRMKKNSAGENRKALKEVGIAGREGAVGQSLLPSLIAFGKLA